MATNTWSGGTDNWNDAANWTTTGATDRVPITGDDVVINTGGATVTMDVNIASGETCESLGSLTITAGTLTTSGSNYTLTVTGTTEVDGTLTCNASTVSLGSGYTSGYGLQGSGTVNFGTGTNTVGAINTTSASGITKTSGTITFNTQKSGSQSIGPSVTNTNSHFNFGTSTVNFDLSGGAGTTFGIEQHSGSSKTLTITATTVNFKSNSYIYQNNTDTNIFKIIGALVIDASKTVTTYYDDSNDYGSKLEVTGDVTVNGILNAYSASNPKPMDFGSLTIASGGEYKATSGTTTMTKAAGSGEWTFDTVSNSTFTHNNGTIKFAASSGDQKVRNLGGENFYNLTVDMANGDLVQGSTGFIVENNLDITLAADHTWRPNTASNTLTVYGNTYLTTGKIGDSTQFTGTMNWGNVTINSGEFILSTGTNNVSGIRNVGGTVSQS